MSRAAIVGGPAKFTKIVLACITEIQSKVGTSKPAKLFQKTCEAALNNLQKRSTRKTKRCCCRPQQKRQNQTSKVCNIQPNRKRLQNSKPDIKIAKRLRSFGNLLDKIENVQKLLENQICGRPPRRSGALAREGSLKESLYVCARERSLPCIMVRQKTSKYFSTVRTPACTYSPKVLYVHAYVRTEPNVLYVQPAYTYMTRPYCTYSLCTYSTKAPGRPVLWYW